jgi:YD repeat-containing protein
MFYDWRDRLVATKSGVQTTEDSTTFRPISFTTYDNLDEATLVQMFDGDGATISTFNGEPQAPSASLLWAQTAYAYDDQGRLFQQQVYSVTLGTGVVSTHALATNVYFDHRGDQIAVSATGGLWTKDVFDGAGRLTTEYTTDGGSGATWADASTVAGDIVLEQSQNIWDGDSNNIETITSQRFDYAGGATGPLDTPTLGVPARVYYTASYFDAADRDIADVNVGTNGGTAWTRPDTVPDRSDTVRVASYIYDAAGWLQDTIDPRGIDTRTINDALDRTTESVRNYTGNPETATSDVTALYTYDGDNHMLTLTALQPDGTPSQETAYVYGVTIAGGSAIDSIDLLATTQYPDPTTGLPSSDPLQQETYTYDGLGETATMTDRNGSTHQYGYDVLGRLTSDSVTTLGAGVDGSVRRLQYAYDEQGNQYLATSYDAPTGGNIVNQVLQKYNGLGQLIGEYQATSGAVDTSTTPEVQYGYTQMSGGQNNSRLISMTYPSGYVVNYNYGPIAGLNDRISRLDSISDPNGTLESYKYLGLGTVVERDHPQTNLNLTYISQTNSTGDGGDKYTGLDRFGRVVEQDWYNTSAAPSVEDLTYSYDRDSNVLTKNNLLNSDFNETYAYDSLNQLASFARANGQTQAWTTDALGNFTSTTIDGVPTDNTFNAQNQQLANGSAVLTFDQNGNMTTDETGRQFVYDAWNRLVGVKDSVGTTLETFAQDALGRKVATTQGSNVTTLFYSNQWQVLEEKVDGVTTFRYVWSPVYVDAMVLRDQLASDGSLDQRLYAVQDANWNVTALADTSGAAVERFVYSPLRRDDSL